MIKGITTYLRRKLHHHFHHPNYLLFMLSLVGMLIIPPISPVSEAGLALLHFNFGLVIAFAVLYTTTNVRELILLFIGGVLLFVLFVHDTIHDTYSLFNAAVSICFFVFTFIKVISYVLKERHTTANTILACVSGYLILGILCSPLFYTINRLIPESFNCPPNPEFYDFLYYSFVTATTLGYGDITPVHPIAKSISVILSVSAQMYLTFVVAIIIGKYLATQNVHDRHKRLKDK